MLTHYCRYFTVQPGFQSLKLTFKQLDAAMKSMNLEKITATMDKFEKSFENLDLTTSVMEGSMGDAMATSAPSGQVDALIQQVFFIVAIQCSPLSI